MELPRRQARKQVAELSVSGAALAGGDLRARSPLRLKQEKRDRQRSLCSACAPTSPVLPVCKSYQQRKKISTRLLVLGVHPPPSRGKSPYYPYAKVISGAKSGPPCTPPHPGQAPLLPVCKSYQRRKKRPAVYPPPSGAGPAITRMQKLSAVHKATSVAKWCRL